MGKMNELMRLLRKGDKVKLEDFFLDRGFSDSTANIAIREFEKAYSEIKNKGETSESNTETSNTK